MTARLDQSLSNKTINQFTFNITCIHMIWQGNYITILYFTFLFPLFVFISAAGQYIYNTCALSKHMGNMCMRLRNAGKGEASPSFFPRFEPNTHIYLYASTVHMYCIYPAILNRK